MIKQVFATKDNDESGPKLVPIVVGQLTKEKESEYGTLLASYFARPDTLFIISSDFCHWGNDFDYTPYENLRSVDEGPEWTPIWQFIEALDMSGLELIEQLNTESFYQYCEETDNTICGRHPIGVLLATV